jgi:predicted DNA-binding transcriptional regulator AlpA
MRRELQRVLETVQEMAPEELPRLLGELEEVRSTAMLRLSVPAAPKPQEDRLLDAVEASQRLGMSKDYLYRNSEKFPFTRRNGRAVRFSLAGIQKYIKTS